MSVTVPSPEQIRAEVKSERERERRDRYRDPLVEAELTELIDVNRVVEQITESIREAVSRGENRVDEILHDHGFLYSQQTNEVFERHNVVDDSHIRGLCDRVSEAVLAKILGSSYEFSLQEVRTDLGWKSELHLYILWK